MVKPFEKKDLFHLKGKKSESLALQYFLNLGYKLFAKNQSINGIEIDLIFKNPLGFLLVEVKSHNSWRLMHPMSKKQKDRLFKAYTYFCDRVDLPCKFVLALVSPHKEPSSRRVLTYSLNFEENSFEQT